MYVTGQTREWTKQADNAWELCTAGDRLHDWGDLDPHPPMLAAGLLKGLPQDQFEQLRQRFMQRVDELFPSKRQRVAKKKAGDAGKLPCARHAASAIGCLSH